MMELSELYDKIGYTFKDRSLLIRALTHSSFDPNNHYERLEFLGDSIVGYAVSDLLYHTGNEREGAMTDIRKSMVSQTPLAALSDMLGLSQLCRKKNCSLSDRIKCNLYEALTGAIALDGGTEEAVSFVKRTIRMAPSAGVDYKTKLKEYCEKNHLSYHAPSTASGADNKKVFTVEVYVGGKSGGVGKGKTIKQAENEACRIALASLKVN